MAKQARKMSSINGARQGRSTTVSRGRVHMWTRLGTHHTLRDGEGGGGGGRGVRGMRWDKTERVHNGYVRQGWILLINPTGYIVPLARDGYNPLHPIPPRSRRRNEDALICVVSVYSLLPHSPFLDLLFSTVSTRAARERYPFVEMSCVVEYRAAGVHRYYITLIMRACAKGGTGP